MRFSFPLALRALSIGPCLLWRLSQSQDADTMVDGDQGIRSCYLNAEEGCTLEGKECGLISDRCGGTIDCGGCGQDCTDEWSSGGCNSCGTRCASHQDCSAWPYNTGKRMCADYSEYGIGHCTGNKNMCTCVPATCDRVPVPLSGGGTMLRVQPGPFAVGVAIGETVSAAPSSLSRCFNRKAEGMSAE